SLPLPVHIVGIEPRANADVFRNLIIYRPDCCADYPKILVKVFISSYFIKAVKIPDQGVYLPQGECVKEHVLFIVVAGSPWAVNLFGGIVNYPRSASLCRLLLPRY